MATYISNLKFTEQGTKALAQTTKRAAAFKSAAKKMGAKVVNAYWTLGEYDGVLVFEAPDDETATALMLHMSQAGNVKTNTTRAFTASEMDKVLGIVGK